MDITIVVTTYNYAQYLEQCINSCLYQKPSDLEYEIIIVNDGSSDGTAELLNKIQDNRLRIIHQKNSGIEIAANRGFREAKGKFVVRVDADDILSNNYLSTISPWLVNDSCFIYPDYKIINNQNTIEEHVKLPSFNPEEVLQRGDFLATGTIYPRTLLLSTGGYNTCAKNCGLENYELIIKLVLNGVPGLHVAKPLFHYRRHDCNISVTRIREIISYGKDLFEHNGLGEYTTNQFHPYKLILSPNQ